MDEAVTIDKVSELSTEVISARAYNIIAHCRSRLMLASDERGNNSCIFYGHMSMSVDWKESNKVNAMGAKITREGAIQCLYNPVYIITTTPARIIACIEHMMDHLVRLHTIRTVAREHEVWDVATDMVVNGHAGKPNVGFYDEKTKTTIHATDEPIFLNNEWPDNSSAEEVYDLLIKGPKKPKKKKDDSSSFGGQCGEGDGDGEEGEGEDGDGDAKGKTKGKGKGKPNSKGGSGSGEGHGDMADDHSIWHESDVSMDEARQIVNDMVDSAANRSIGQVPGHLTEAIKNLKTPIVMWRDHLRHLIGRSIGNERPTYSRENRRRQEFGIKGFTKRAASKVKVIVDTSGSISTKELEQFFSEIEAISYKAEVKVLLWDHAFQGYSKYRKGDWESYQVNGRGGTNMVEPFTWLENEGEIGQLVILLTDGYTPWPPPKQYQTIFVITNDAKTVSAPEWGEVIRMNLVGE